MVKKSKVSFSSILVPMIFAVICPVVAMAGALQNQGDQIRSGGGHEVPTPFSTVNQRFELADGEYYVLSGRVVLLETVYGLRPYLNIDFQCSPWLANAERKAFPYYQLEGTPEFWSKWDGKRVKMMTQAKVEGVNARHPARAEVILTPFFETLVR